MPMNNPHEFWNNRYANARFVYGTKPNDWFAKCLQDLAKGTLLLPAEGEGRNAVYATKLGWEVNAVDFSESAKAKAIQLAAREKAKLASYEIGDLADFPFVSNHYDAVGLIYVHIPSAWRSSFHKRMEQSLKGGGHIIVEAFEKSQLGKNGGGAKNLDQLYDLETVKNDFQEINWLHVEYLPNHKLKEGDGHNGDASVIRLFGVKKDA
jgi:SAM-dependent methyltransferase